METVEVFYWLPHCTTCQRAEHFLKEQGVTIHQYVNLKTDGVTRDTLKAIAQKLGGVDKLFSKRAIKYRTMGLHARALTTDEMLELMEQEYTFIKRPVVLTKSGRVLAGFTKKQFESLVN